jgi:hypothetical protein
LLGCSWNQSKTTILVVKVNEFLEYRFAKLFNVREPAMDSHDGLMEIHDPEIDPARIMEEIRGRIQRRREELGYPRQIFPTFGAAAYPGEPGGEDYDIELYFHLRRANETYHQIGVESLIVPSLWSSIPILGPLWDRIRREAHNLVLFYVNKLAQRQATVNRHLVSTLNRMVLQIQEQQRRIQAMEEELCRLREGS